MWRSFSSIPSECTVPSLRPDLAPSRSIRAPNIKEVNAAAAAACGGAFLFSWWEFHLPQGRKKGSTARGTRPCFDCPYCKA